MSSEPETKKRQPKLIYKEDGCRLIAMVYSRPDPRTLIYGASIYKSKTKKFDHIRNIKSEIRKMAKDRFEKCPVYIVLRSEVDQDIAGLDIGSFLRKMVGKYGVDMSHLPDSQRYDHLNQVPAWYVYSSGGKLKTPELFRTELKKLNNELLETVQEFSTSLKKIHDETQREIREARVESMTALFSFLITEWAPHWISSKK